MNTYNEWERLRDIANKSLKQHGAMLSIHEDEDGYYSIDILYGLDFTAEPFDITKYKECETFATNYYESELSEVINDAWGHALNKI